MICKEGDNKYEAARALATVDRVLGWLVVVCGILCFLTSYSTHGGEALARGLGGVGAAFFGVLMVSAGQMIEAHLDTADNTRRTKELLQRALLGGKVL